MKTIQETFDAVIEAGLYYESVGQWPDLSPYMCSSLRVAAERWVITLQEARVARESIEAYLGDSPYLYSFLASKGLPNSPKDCLAVYKDWENRP